jgi:hypothetical protein
VCSSDLEVEQLKDMIYGKDGSNKGDGKVKDNYSSAIGDVLNNDTKGFIGIQHGHSGIHSANHYSTIEALGYESATYDDNPRLKRGIRYLHNTIRSYWNNPNKVKVFSARYERKWATRQQNINAAFWASSKKTFVDNTNTRINKHISYCATKVGFNECYNCATLVESAWNAQGQPIRYEAYVGNDNRPRYNRVQFPYQFKLSKDLKRVQVYHW